MKIALVLKDAERRELGKCLSQASCFAVFDTLTGHESILSLPEGLGFHHVAVALSRYLKQNDIEKLGALDLGPKAKAHLEGQGIKWYRADGEWSIEDNFKSMINN